MMPVASQDAVLNAAPIQRKTHMRAAIVEREDMPALVHEEDRAMAAAHDKSPFGFQLFEGARAHEVRCLSIHGRLIRQAVCPDAHSARALPVCQCRLRCTSISYVGLPSIRLWSTTVAWREPCGDSWSRGDEDPLPLFCLPASARGPALCDGTRYTHRRAPHNALGNRTHRLHRQVYPTRPARVAS